jgi:hypothetical protein
MENATQETGPGGRSMLDVLDRTLLNHLERITGAREGVNGLPVNLLTTACIVLLAERAGAPGGSQEDAGGAYGESEFMEDLAEIGIENGRRLRETLKSLSLKGYVEIGRDGVITVKEPVVSMARLLDRAFPGMPGMNLVAYFIQTLDEVESDRKDARAAVLQLDQMLKRHGATPPKTAAPKKTPKRGLQRPARLKRPTRLTLPADMAAPAPRPADPHPPEPPEPPLPADEQPPADEPPPVEAEPAEGLIDHAADPHAGEPPAAPLPEEVPESASLEAPGDEELAPEPGSPRELPATFFEPAAPAAPAPEEDPAHPDGRADENEKAVTAPGDPVEEQVAEFEEKLAMQCPICRKSSIAARETAKGRTYYKCVDEKCMFISWGRPHHTPCPLCGNPFLVEEEPGGGSGLLRCPRATCRYREGSVVKGDATPARPKRKVVRRRVVRRKR